MIATELVTDSWDGDRNIEAVVPSPTWDQIAKAIQELDGMVRTLVTITIQEPSHMAIGGGGGNGLYVVYATRDGERFRTATRQIEFTKKAVVNAGGQEGEFPENRCVELATALTAAKSFAESGQLDPAIKWED